jgi:hypothetical protein
MSLFYLCSEIGCNRKYKTKNKLVGHLLQIHKIIADQIDEPVEINKQNKKTVENIKNLNKQSEQRELLIKEAEIKQQLELIAKKEAEELYKQQQLEKWKLIEEQKLRLQDEQLRIDQINFEKLKLSKNETSHDFIEQAERKPICSICLDDDANAAIVPCGHSNFCYDCISSYHINSQHKVCPICRNEIMMVVKLYV